MKKTTVFTLIALALPFVFLALLEGGLRLAGVQSEARRAFQPVPGHPDDLLFNPSYAARYFRGFQPSVAYTPFRREKRPEAFRIFILGGSSAAGFPYHFYYAFPERLSQRLEAAVPGRPVEVVNLAMTAVNSYTLADLAGTVAAQSPDAVLIYAGHNEYYGAFGAGSALYGLGHQRWLKRLVLTLKHSALYLALEAVLAPAPAPDASDRTMMARVVRDAGIAPGGAVFRKGVAQFSANMADVMAVFRAAGVPVYLGTLTSNLADQPPLGEGTAAAAAYAEGQRLRAAGDTLGARAAFLRAKAEDVIRFRAPEAMNDVLRTLAETPGVTLVEVADAFRMHSPGGLEGAALFDDHLHPNARGYDLMAEAFFAALRPTLAPAPDAPDLAPPVLDPYEAALVDLQLARLKGGYPFDKTVTPEEEARRFAARLAARRRAGVPDSLAVATLTAGLPPPAALLAAVRHARATADTLAALRLYRSLLAWQPFNVDLKDEAVGFAVASGGTASVVPELARAAVRHTRRLDHLNALAAVELQRGRLATADTLLAVVERRDPASKVMLFNKARLLVLQGDTLAARAYFARYRAP